MLYGPGGGKAPRVARQEAVMTDPGFVPATERGLLAVYSTPEEARAAADRIEALGVRPESIRIAEKADEVASLRAEMREELTKSWFMPTVTEHVVSNLRGEGYRPVDHPERDADRSSRPADPPR
jgi:hypothetical protein